MNIGAALIGLGVWLVFGKVLGAVAIAIGVWFFGMAIAPVTKRELDRMAAKAQSDGPDI